MAAASKKSPSTRGAKTRLGAAAVLILAAAALAARRAAGQGGASPVGPKASEMTTPSAVAQGEPFSSGDYNAVLPMGLQASAAFVRDDNPMSLKKISLGRMLYFDPRLSADGKLSCATCHDPSKGFADGRKTSIGIHGKSGARNAPTVINRLFSADQFWDGRAADLEAQALGPVQNPIEMGNTMDGMTANLKRILPYAGLFRAAFGTPEITASRVAQAIASYERTILSGGSPYDRYQAGETKAMSESAVRGLALFNDTTRANCVTCHAGFNFTDESYHNLGVGMDAAKPDLGRFEITKNEVDKGAFKTPTLRNVTETAPYMHDGSDATLLEVIDLYDRGGNPNPWLSKEIKSLHLTDQEKQDLVAFMKALTAPVLGTERPSLP